MFTCGSHLRLNVLSYKNMLVTITIITATVMKGLQMIKLHKEFLILIISHKSKYFMLTKYYNC